MGDFSGLDWGAGRAGGSGTPLASGASIGSDCAGARSGAVACRTGFHHGPFRPFTILKAGPGSNRCAGIDKLVASRTVVQS
jgi:hypothetical protein